MSSDPIPSELRHAFGREFLKLYLFLMVGLWLVYADHRPVVEVFDHLAHEGGAHVLAVVLTIAGFLLTVASIVAIAMRVLR